MTTPKNISFSHASKYRLVFPYMPFMDSFSSIEKERGKDFTLYCSSVVLPAVMTTPFTVENPYYNMKITNPDQNWGELQATYSVDEYFINYEFLLNWFKSIHNPEEYALNNTTRMITASLHIYSNNENPKFRFTLVNIFPTNLGSISFTKESMDAEDLKHNVTFSIDYYKLER